MSHTPGPWGLQDGGRYVEAAGGQTGPLAEVSELMEYGEGEREANARLIAAAPDLLASLEEIVLRRERVGSTYGASPDGTDGRYARARAAITKARGGA